MSTYQLSDGTVVHINQPDTFWVRAIRTCWNCEQPRRIVGFDQLWYGVTWCCCYCGDGWADGETLERPFARGWRKKAIDQARARWGEAVRFLGPEHKAWMAAQLDAEREFAEQVPA